MSKSLSVIELEKNDSFTRIRKFMSGEESGIVLNANEEKMLTRWQYTHALKCERKFKDEEIAVKISERFDVSIFTARNDLKKTYCLFVEISAEYKQYTLFHQVEYIDQLLNKWKDDKSLAGLIPKLLAEKTRALVAMPVETKTPDVPASYILIRTTTEIVPAMKAADALIEADKLIEFEKSHEYLEHTDIRDDENESA